MFARVLYSFRRQHDHARGKVNLGPTPLPCQQQEANYVAVTILAQLAPTVLLWRPICRRRHHRASQRFTFPRCCRFTIGPASMSALTAAGAGAMANSRRTPSAHFRARPVLVTIMAVVGGTLGANF